MSSINEIILNQEIIIKIPTRKSKYVNKWPDIFVVIDSDIAVFVDVWLIRHIPSRTVIDVACFDHILLSILYLLINSTTSILRDQSNESLGMNQRLDATIISHGAIVLKHSVVYDNMVIGRNNLIKKLFDGSQNLFPKGQLEIIGVVTSYTASEIHTI